MAWRPSVCAYLPEERVRMRTSFALRPRPGMRDGGTPDYRGTARGRGPEAQSGGYHWWRTAAITAAVGVFSAVVQGPLWREDAALAAVNLTTSVLFVFTGLMPRREPGQRGVAWALILLGVLRPLDFVDAWSGPPWAIYTLLFGAIDRVFGAYVLLRYPNSSL